MKSNQLIEHEFRQRFRLDYRLEMREVSFVGECSIDLSKLDQPLNGKCAYLGQNLFNDKTKILVKNPSRIVWVILGNSGKINIFGHKNRLIQSGRSMGQDLERR